jgi:hypothetical protein
LAKEVDAFLLDNQETVTKNVSPKPKSRFKTTFMAYTGTSAGRNMINPDILKPKEIYKPITHRDIESRVPQILGHLKNVRKSNENL